MQVRVLLETDRSEYYGREGTNLGKKHHGYKSTCMHCGMINFSKDTTGQQVCKMRDKEYLATVAHTEEY